MTETSWAGWNPERLAAEIEETAVPYGMVAVWWLGQGSFVLKGGTSILYIDPFAMGEDELKSRHGLKRSYPPLLEPEHIRHADYCLITHEHIDHLDPAAIAAMAKQKRETIYMSPRCCIDVLVELGVPANRITAADVRKPHVDQNRKLAVQPVPAAHEELEPDEHGYHRYVGYVIRFNGVHIYHAGDTLVYGGLPERLKQENIDLAFVPINGRDVFRTDRGIVGNMNYREAAELAHLANFRTTVPMHYDMFPGNTEHPGYFVDYVYDRYPHLPVAVLARGRRFLYASDEALR
ncbi:MBL fold metallo-hydrolase [Paenibacillus thailandensis]|uniref:MBL fold metallo-hydrolase n=1 Tax=Paenibacillus thailandensis TaxID=393250 RepID=A0ABW5QSH4_9BACL